MKKFVAIALTIAVLLSCSGCGLLILLAFGTERTTNPDDYYSDDCYGKLPSWMPATLEEYTVNDFSYCIYSYLDICYEIFLDITVTEEQLASILSAAREGSPLCEQDAYYAEGYQEIVFEDFYEIDSLDPDIDHNYPSNVGWADIEKIVYNPQTLNVVFVCFHANDTGVYDLSDVAYFKRFEIDQEDYVLYIMQTDEETTE